MSKIAVVTYHDSDLLELLKENSSELTLILPHDIANFDLDIFDSIAVLGGGDDTPLLLEPKQRLALERQIKLGKKVFAEYISSIGNVYFSNPESTRYDRLVYCSSTSDIPNLKLGTLLDDQCGNRITPHSITCSHEPPILQYTRVHAHDHIDLDDSVNKNVSERALWFDDPKNLLICSFRISCFRRARYAPWEDIKKVVEFILGWLLPSKEWISNWDPIYTTGNVQVNNFLEEKVIKCANKSIKWFEGAGILLEKGKMGALEGFGTEIYSNGSQRLSRILRADCIGEISLPYFFDYMLNGNKKSEEISDNLLDFVFDHYICRDDGPLYGMMRWTNEAWGVCYQDDVARAIIPQLLRCLYQKTDKHLNDCVDSLMFLVKTTGSDGTRVFRTDNINLSSDKIRQLKENPGNFPSAHYNGYYYSALLLAYKLTNKPEFKETAIKGLTTIMHVYPNTVREQSETQEYCRLIQPLSHLYWVTGESVHKKWLYQVVNDLGQFKHSSGGYLEWDSGYKASMRNEIGKGESSLIAKNGDSVVDLLYSNNWLPLAFMQAYLITGDKLFKELWEDIARFFISSQIHSDNANIDGAWARAYDVNKKEVFGSPADLGWGPWAIESGWTVAEISAGLLMGLLENDLVKHYR
ncbi:hypothetical protein [Lederbergia ruris]|uniref:hypothetical protein n=1 Tax=Lederbergia ruris TaxID=217495 RepID=UPI0039A28D72